MSGTGGYDFYKRQWLWSELFPPVSTFTINGQFVDTDKFNIIPKPEYLEQQIKDKEAEIEANERAMQASQRYYQTIKERLLQEKEGLVSQRKKK